jgi:hypothetical protein
MQRSPIRVRPVLLAAAVACSPASFAVDLPLAAPYAVEGVTYAAGVPKPEAVLGHRVGTRHSRPDQLVEYFRAVAAASDRVVVREHGRSFEGRPLIHAIVTSPANQARLEAIRQANLRLSDAAETVSDAELAELPVVVYQGFSVHGDEASGSEAALVYLYHLAAGQGAPVESLLERAVFIVDPSLNPDGRARFVDWVNGNRGGAPTADPQDREHEQPWPQGRTNHYLFDLNRDWLAAQLPETQGRLALYHGWRPQLLTDHHEMGSDATFFFQPGIPSRNNPLTPQRVYDLTGEIARYHARRLDQLGSLYFRHETFDDYYYGKGSSYPDLNGGVGILFEQAGAEALLRETRHGVLSYAFTVRNHLATALSTAEAAAALRERLLRNQRDFYREAAGVAQANGVKGWVIGLDGDRTRAQALAELLRRHRIRVHALARDWSGSGQAFRAGEAYVVPLAQPQARLLKSMMEGVATFGDVLFYDVSTWTLPYAFGVRYAALTVEPAGLLGDELAEAGADGGRLVGDGETPAYAYVLEWDRYFAPRALRRVLEAGVRPLVTTRPLTLEGSEGRHTLGRGAIVIPARARDAEGGPRPEEVRALVKQAVAQDHVVVHAVQTGLAVDGPDLGSPSSPVLKLPRVAILSGAGTSANDVGTVWHLLSERFGLSVTLLDRERLGSADLSRYDTLVVAGRCEGLDAGRLKAWVEAGGLLIATEEAARWAVEKQLVPEKLRELKRPEAGLAWDEVQRTRGAQLISGSIFEARLDTSHPLAFGLGEHVALFRTHNRFFEPSEAPAANVGLYTDAPLLSGYVSKENLAAIAGSAAILARRVEKGRVVLFADDPAFRGFWWGSSRLLLNAVFFGRVL